MYKKYPIEAQFSGPDPAVLHSLADSAAAIMRADDKVRLITTDWEPKVPVLTVDYNQPVARRIGLSRSDVGMSLLCAAGGIPASSFYEGIRKNTIYVKTVDKNGRPVDDLNETNIFSLIPSFGNFTTTENMQKVFSGTLTKQDIVEALMTTIPLKDVSQGVKVNWEDPLVIRYNGQRAQRVECSPASGIGTEAARQSIAKKIEKIKLPAGYKLEWIGEKRASDDAMTYLFKNFPMAIILMIAILIMLFKDYKMPVIIFCCIPLILIGVIPAVLISGKSFGFVAIVGVLGLIGMMIKTGIVLMDEIKFQMQQGESPVEALVRSSQSRLRPVVMASLTTILGMIPLLPDAMFGSLAATIMGGLFAGTIVVLIFIPVLYAMFFHIKLK
jgi:Cation/multidrug efflux pump